MAYIMHSAPPPSPIKILYHLLELGQGVQHFTIGFTSLRPSIVQSV